MKAIAAATKRLETVKVLAPEVVLGAATTVPEAVLAAEVTVPEAAEATTGAAAEVPAAAAEVTEAAAAELNKNSKKLVLMIQSTNSEKLTS